jgi:hypothetical protein
MKTDFEKTMHITSELLSYCHIKGACDFCLDIAVLEDDFTQYKIKASPARLSEKDLSLLKKQLDTPRRPEMEHEHWGLSGESENFSELSLLGMMTDNAVVEYDEANFFISITLSRKNL